MSEYAKVIRDGKVAVLYSPGYGAGWYSWNTGHESCLFHPEVVNRVLNNEPVTQELCDELFGNNFYAGGARDLQVEWLLPGERFTVDEYDGSESITTIESLGLVA